MKTIILFLVGLAFVQFDVIRNLRIILAKKKTPDYTLSALLRLAVGGVLVVIRHGLDLLPGFVLLATFASWFWLLFDPLLNYGRALAWDYLGTASESDQLLDDFLPWDVLAMRLGLVVISSSVYLVFFAGL